MSTTSAASLVEALSKYRILDQVHLDKLNCVLQGRSPDSRALAKEMVKHGWLTTYQANLLLNGRGAELVLGEYLLLDRLGEGGMGEVFKARHRLMNRIVALKIIRKERLVNADSVKRFHREIQMAAQLDHPNLVRAHDAAQVGDTHFLVMEYAEGLSLHQLVDKSGPLPVGQACVFIRQAALGLQHASERNMVHRDIKPSNLQVTAQGTVVKVLDMGLARSQAPAGNAGVKTELTQASSILGTPDYISPEQINDPRRVDIRADIYSLGCTFYFMLAGHPPFPDCAWQEKLVSHGRVEPKPIEQIRAEVPPALGAVLRKMMAKRPEDRYATPAALADALVPFCSTVSAPPPVVAAAIPGGPAQPAAIPAGQLQAAVPALPASSLVTPGGYEPGWSLEASSTTSAAPSPSTQGQSRPLSAEQTVLGPQLTQAVTPPGQPAAPSPVQALLADPWRLWLIVAGGGVFLVLILFLLWPKGPAPKLVVATGPVLQGLDLPFPMIGHEGNATCKSLVFMPDGKQAVSYHGSNLYVWNLENRSRIARWDAGALGSEGVVAVSRDRGLLAASSFPIGTDIGVFDRETHQKKDTFKFSDGSYSFSFSPDSSRLAAAERDRVRVIDLQTKMEKEVVSGRPVCSVAFSPDGQLLVLGSGEPKLGKGPTEVRLWKLADLSQPRIFEAHTKAVTHVAFAADGKRCYSASLFDKTICVWNNDTDKAVIKEPLYIR